MLGETGKKAYATYIPIKVGERFPLVWVRSGATCIAQKCPDTGEISDHINVFLKGEDSIEVTTYEFGFKGKDLAAIAIDPHVERLKKAREMEKARKETQEMVKNAEQETLLQNTGEAL